jgi:hypothetical protein
VEILIGYLIKGILLPPAGNLFVLIAAMVT